MATQIVILNNDYIRVDDKFHIHWVDKGKNWNNSWLPNTIHAVIWNNLTGQNQIQNKDATTGAMASNSVGCVWGGMNKFIFTFCGG